MKKLNKKSASLAALQIGTALSPLTVLAQASADTVDDAVAKAESAGLKVRVEDKGDVKVNSKAEADTKNAEADAQLKADAVKVAQAVDSYVAEKTTVQKANQEAQTRYETEVKAEDARVAKLEAEAQKTNTQNTEAQKAYEAEKAKVEAQNAESQKAYEAEKAKVEAQNAEAQKAYEAEKAKVEAQNAEKLKAYETELANTKAENAKLLAQYEAELQKAKEANQKGNQSNADEVARIQAENEKAQKAYEAELARVTAERDALTKQYEAEKARIEKENAVSVTTTTADAAKIEADYQAALKVYDQKVKDITAQNQKAQADYEAAKKAVEAKNAKIDADYAAAKKAYDAKLAQVTASNKAKQDAYDKALADYKAGKLDTVTNKEKTLTMEVTKAPAGVTVQPARTIEKDLTNSTNLDADLKVAEAEFKAEEAKVNAQLDAFAKTPAEEPVDENARAMVTKELKAAKDWADAQNKLGQEINVRYVIKEKVVTGKQATVDAIKSAYDDAKAKMDNEALVSQHFTSTTTPGGYDWVGSKNRFIQTWADIKQTYSRYQTKEAAEKAAQANKKVKVVDYDLTELEGYNLAKQSVATGVVNNSNDLPAEVLAWREANGAKRQELMASNGTETYTGANTPSRQVLDPTAYKAKVDEFNRNLPDIQAQVDAYNETRKDNIVSLLAGDLNTTIGSSDSGNRVINNNNMTFTKSSNNVKYLRSQNFSTLDDAMHQGFDIANSANSESSTPVENKLAKVNFTAVRIPKGESVTVEYTRKDGKDYLLPENTWTRSTMFVKDSDYAKKDTFTDSDGQALNKIRYTVRNDGSISSDGDLIVFFMNDTAVPVYFGISNMGSPEGSNRFKLMSDPRQSFGTTTTTEFLNSGNEALRATLSELNVVYPDKTDPSTFKLLHGKRYIKGNLPSVDNAPVKEYVSRPDVNAGVQDHGTNFGNSLKPVSTLTDLPTNWKDTESWVSRQSGWDGAKLIAHQKSFNRENVDKAVHPTNVRYQVSEVETGFFNASSALIVRMPTVEKFNYVSSEATYISARPVGELVRTIEVPVVRGADASSTPREVTPVKMVIKYKEVKKGTEPTKPTLEQVPTTPPAVNKDPLPTAPLPTPLPEKPVKGQVKPGTQKPLPEQPKLPELPKKPTPKPLPDAGTVVVEPKKPTLKSEPVKPPLTPTPEKPSLVTPPNAPKLKDVPKPPTSTTTPKVERKVIEKPKLQEEPKAPELTLSKVHYVYQPNTIWVTVDGKVLRNKEDGEKPKDTFNGYEYVRTEKDKDGNIRHIYKPVEKPQEQPKVKTIWETVDGKVLRNWEDGEKPKDGFDGYEYVRTDKDKDGNIHHIYKPAKKVTTIWVTVDGKVLRERKDGTLPKDSFDGYEYVRTDVDKDGNTTHVFKPVKKVTTIWVTVDGKVLRERKEGTLPKDSFDGYEYVRTDVDKDGNTTHVFKPVEKPVKKVTTIWVTVDGKVLRERKEGTLPKDSFDGYEFVETRVDEDGNTTHIFKPVVKSIKTIWQTVDQTITLREWQDGEQPKDTFDGYEYVRTETDEDGNIHHLYKLVVKETPKEPSKPEVKPDVQPQTSKELPKTGDAGTITSLLGGFFAGTGFFGMKRKKNRKK